MFNRKQWQLIYNHNPKVVDVRKKRRKQKHDHTKKGYLLMVWKGYYDKALDGKLAFYIQRSDWTSFFLDNKKFNEAFNRWSLNGFNIDDTPFISKEDKNSKWNLSDLVIRPLSEIKIRKESN